jgi:hypothetical protein
MTPFSPDPKPVVMNNEVGPSRSNTSSSSTADKLSQQINQLRAQVKIIASRQGEDEEAPPRYYV